VVGSMLSESYTDCAMVKKISSGEDYALVISKENPVLTEKVNAAIDDLSKDGTIDSLLTKWNLNL
jgi:polar amino acid transport system substrate-binding protein